MVIFWIMMMLYTPPPGQALMTGKEGEGWVQTPPPQGRGRGMVRTTPNHLNLARSAGKQAIYIEGGWGFRTPPPKHRGRGVVARPTSTLDMSEMALI